MAVWINDDGLRIYFGVEEAIDTAIGEYGAADPGSTHLVQLLLTPETLGGVGKVVHDAVRLAGANGQTMYVKSAEIFVEEPFESQGDAFTLTIGLDNQDGTVFDADGIDAAIPETSLDAEGDTVVCDGDQVDTRLDNTQPLFVTTTVGGAAPTAGRGWLRLHWFLVNP